MSGKDHRTRTGRTEGAHCRFISRFFCTKRAAPVPETDIRKSPPQIAPLAKRRIAILTGILLLAFTILTAAVTQDISSAGPVRIPPDDIDRILDRVSASANAAPENGVPLHRLASRSIKDRNIALYLFSPAGKLLSITGETPVPADPATLSAIFLSGKRGQTIETFPQGDLALSWVSLDNGEILLAATPVPGNAGIAPLYLLYIIVTGIIFIFVISLVIILLRQNDAAVRATGLLSEYHTAFNNGRVYPWSYHHAGQTIIHSGIFPVPPGSGPEERKLHIHSVPEVVHPDDLSGATAVLSGIPPGKNEGTVRLRNEDNTWKRFFLRTIPDTESTIRTGVAFDLEDSALEAGRETETCLQDAIESIPEIFVLWDEQGRLAAWNRLFRLLFRIPSGMLKPGMTVPQTAVCAGMAGDILATCFGPLNGQDADNAEVALPESHWAHVSRRKTAANGYVCTAVNLTDLKRRDRIRKNKLEVLQQTIRNLGYFRSRTSGTVEKHGHERQHNDIIYKSGEISPDSTASGRDESVRGEHCKTGRSRKIPAA